MKSVSKMKFSRKGFFVFFLTLAICFVSMPSTSSAKSKADDFNWLIIDDKATPVRHWIIKNRVVIVNGGTHVTCFEDKYGNRIRILGRATVVEIKQPLSEFLLDYRKKYGIPADCKALE